MHPTPLFHQKVSTRPFEKDQPQKEEASLRTNDLLETLNDANYGAKLVELIARKQDYQLRNLQRLKLKN